MEIELLEDKIIKILKDNKKTTGRIGDYFFSKEGNSMTLHDLRENHYYNLIFIYTSKKDNKYYYSCMDESRIINFKRIERI